MGHLESHIGMLGCVDPSRETSQLVIQAFCTVLEKKHFQSKLNSGVLHYITKEAFSIQAENEQLLAYLQLYH